ncbi:hypothetical protein HHI36_022025 [Cryptolaemus montrouzieri]|uniref:Mediator of RNA polymerase II transcription subunit 26 n=1 Tax=Cryptolaemus montrouzieri TaxID=559131 RepID=A0ABD2MYH1_9CUCU
MQNNITEITQRLLRSLDNNYNVIDMPAVVEIISILEKVAITKELLATTRLGKYVNELRRKTTNESLSKRAKELVKKWKNLVLPETNGQLKQNCQALPSTDRQDIDKSRKRPAQDPPDNISQIKRTKINGQTSEFDFSDNSNSSFKDVIHSNKINELKANANVILINSDSNSSLPDTGRQDPPLEQQLPKKRGRKKGSKNHRNLVDEAESSFTSKLAVSRGNSKVKTTQELIAGLQNKSNTSILNLPPLNSKPKEDLNQRAAKLTERVSIIDQTLYTNSNRSKQKNRFSSKLNFSEKNDRIIESGSVINDKSLSGHTSTKDEDEEIIVVDDIEPNEEIKEEEEEEQPEPEPAPSSVTVEEILAQLPPVDRTKLDEDSEDEPWCSCYLKENKSFFSVVDEGTETEPEQQNRFEFVEDDQCAAKTFYTNKYHFDDVDECRVHQLSQECLPNVNGNLTVGPKDEIVEKDEYGLFVNVVPNVYSECKLKGDTPDENFKKYSISENAPVDETIEKRTGDNAFKGFAEWHECIETPSYNGEILKILPYVVID